ncbi:MAG TPA: hypothetical protein VJV23_12765 [Candidatus Polarisedimenticolia bacterium]|nr:hypothetical protein [Candidatus Polarisedimenticolia bacterium]
MALLEGRAPHPLRLTAARGVLPITRMELAAVLVALSQDEDSQIRQEASRTLAAYPEQELHGILSDPAAPAALLAHVGTDPASPVALRDAVLQNGSTPVDAIKAMIPGLGAAQMDLLLLNQTRLIAAPDLLDALAASHGLTPLQRVRVEEIRRHFLSQASPATPPPAARAPEASPAAGPVEATVPETAVTDPGAVEPSAAQAIENATRKILRLNTSEKIQLAYKGTREERSILIKDSSKSVQEAVLQSPKLTENEVESISKMRSVTEEVLRLIATNRDWMKNYSIVHSLATNPKTPAGIAMTMVARLTSRDLKLVAGDKNVPEVIRRQARKVADARNERAGGRAGH